MRRLKRPLATAATIIMVLTLAPVSLAWGDEADKLIANALKGSGVAGQLEMLTTTILESLPGDTLTGKEKKETEKYLKRRFGKDAIVAKVHTAIRQDFDQNAIVKVVGFYLSRLGKKVGSLQRRTLAPSSIVDVREGRKTVALMTEPRIALLKRIIRSDRVSEANAGLLSSMVRGLAEGSVENDEGHTEGMPKKLELLVDQARLLRGHTEQVALVAYARTFRSLSDKELEQLALFHESHEASWFRNAVQAGLEATVHEVSKALGEFIRRLRDAPEPRPRESR